MKQRRQKPPPHVSFYQEEFSYAEQQKAASRSLFWWALKLLKLLLISDSTAKSLYSVLEHLRLQQLFVQRKISTPLCWSNGRVAVTELLSKAQHKPEYCDINTVYRWTPGICHPSWLTIFCPNDGLNTLWEVPSAQSGYPLIVYWENAVWEQPSEGRPDTASLRHLSLGLVKARRKLFIFN